MMLQVLGWVTSACFMLCVVPQTISCIRARSAGTLTWPFLLMWFIGCLTGSIYVAVRADWPLLANYGFSLLNVGVLVWYKVRDGRQERQ